MTTGLLPFLGEFKRAVLEGRKTLTARKRSYGVAGDVLATPWGVRVQLVEVRELELGLVAAHHWERGGQASPRDFVEAWLRCFPEEPWDPARVVYLHEFRVIEEAPASPIERTRRPVGGA